MSLRKAISRWNARINPTRVWCRVYWGTHGCWKNPGHKGVHRCDCKAYIPPKYKGHVYGEDA